MKQNFQSLFFASVLGFAFLAPQGLLAEEGKTTEAKKEETSIVAEVNKTKITTAELDKELKRRLRGNAGSFKEDQLKVLKTSLLDKMVERELLLQAAQSSGIKADPKEVEKVVTDLKQRVGGPEAFTKGLQQEGLTEAAFVTGLSTDMVLKNYIESNVLKSIQITEADAKATYDATPEKFAAPEQVRARHILFMIPQTADDAKRAEVKAKADAVLAEAKKPGADFAALAKQHSEDGSKDRGGDLGYFTKNMMVEPFANAAFSMKPGEVSDLVASQFGFHIIKVEDHKQAGVPKFEEAKETIIRFLQAEKEKQAIADHLAGLKKSAKVVVNLK